MNKIILISSLFLILVSCKPKHSLVLHSPIHYTEQKQIIVHHGQKREREVSVDEKKEKVLVKKVQKHVELSTQTFQTLKEKSPIAKAPQKEYSKAEKKKIKKVLKTELKKESQSQGGQGSLIVLSAILAFFLPPVAVILFEGEVSRKFWWNLLFTVLWFLPGVIHALLVIFEVI